MAAILPQFIVIKSNYTGKYAYFLTSPESERGFILCGEKHVTSLLSKIEVEVSKCHSNYVHFRFCYNNRYWAKVPNNVFLFAGSKKPVEDKSSPSCTLFEPRIDKEGNLYFMHVQSRRRVAITFDYLFVDEEIDASNEACAFSFVDWKTLVQFPKTNIAFKGDNGKHLGLYWIEGHPYLSFFPF